MAGRPERGRIWDLPTRLFHWLVVLLIPLLWWTAKEEQMERHIALGLIMFGLLAFRLLWGLLGSSTARFAGFVRGPGAILSYLRGRAPAGIGHNPLGALSVLALLAMLSLQVGLGLFAVDEDGLFGGPLSHLVDFDTAEEIAELHETLFYPLLGLIGLHVAALLYYALVRRKNLVGPMLSGRGPLPEGAAEMRRAPAWRFYAAAAPALLLALWMAGLI